jgi:ABC-type transport system substrate-binding protein
MAVFESRTLTLPIVSKEEWAGIAEKAKSEKKPLDVLLKHKIKNPIGTGPYTLEEWKQGAYLFVKKNNHFFGTGQDIKGHTLGPFIDGIIFKFFGTSDAAVMAVKKGTIDMFWWGIKPGYVSDLENETYVRLYESERSALYYMGFNLRKAPFNDVKLRHAIATLVDKDFIIERILQGNGVRMDSLVPPGNRIYYCPDIPVYGKGMDRAARIKKAYEILKGAGYTWDVPPVQARGKIVKGKGIRLPDGKPMAPFTILTPPADYDPERAMAGLIIQEWLREVGIPASSKPMAFGALIDQVSKQHKFDTFILGYGRLSLDPDYLRKFFHSTQDKARGGNKSGYRNPEFDKIADASAAAMDENERQKLVWEMQKILMRDLPWLPLYNPNLTEGVRTDRFKGWVQMLEGIGNRWSFCVLKPK